MLIYFVFFLYIKHFPTLIQVLQQQSPRQMRIYLSSTIPKTNHPELFFKYILRGLVYDDNEITFRFCNRTSWRERKECLQIESTLQSFIGISTSDLKGRIIFVYFRFHCQWIYNSGGRNCGYFSKFLLEIGFNLLHKKAEIS